MVTELVQVLTQIEQQLSGPNANVLEDMLKGSRDDHWMQLYLAASKLLETLCTIPSGYVAQFQMCRWAFVSALSASSLGEAFVPFAVRINRLMNMKYGRLSAHEERMGCLSASLFNIKTLTSFQELHPFYHSLAIQYHHSTMAGISSSTQAMDNHHENGSEMGGGNGEVAEEFRDSDLLTGRLSIKAAVARIEQSL